MIFFIILLTIPKILYYKVRVSTASIETHWLGSSFLMVYRNNAGRLGSGFISMCLETRWLGQKAVSMCWNDPVGRYGFRGIVTASDRSNQKGGKIGSGYVKLWKQRKRQQRKWDAKRRIQLEPSGTSSLCLGIVRHPCDKTHAVFVRQPSAAESCKKMGR